MRSFLHFLLTVFTLGMIAGCGSKPATPAEPRDVTLVVPGMF
jgi:hypothetical protein